MSWISPELFPVYHKVSKEDVPPNRIVRLKSIWSTHLTITTKNCINIMYQRQPKNPLPPVYNDYDNFLYPGCVYKTKYERISRSKSQENSKTAPAQRYNRYYITNIIRRGIQNGGEIRQRNQQKRPVLKRIFFFSFSFSNWP